MLPRKGRRRAEGEAEAEAASPLLSSPALLMSRSRASDRAAANSQQFVWSSLTGWLWAEAQRRVPVAAGPSYFAEHRRSDSTLAHRRL